MYTRMHTYIYTYVHMYIYIYIYICIYTHILRYIYIYIYVCVLTSVYTYTYIYIYIYCFLSTRKRAAPQRNLGQTKNDLLVDALKAASVARKPAPIVGGQLLRERPQCLVILSGKKTRIFHPSHYVEACYRWPLDLVLTS